MTPRYWAFSFDTYYPGGGINDRVGMFNTVEEARAALVSDTGDWREIVDIETGDVIEVIRRKPAP